MVRRIEKIETAIEPRFQEHFVGAMAIPHTSAPYPNLAKVVDLPSPPEPVARALPSRTPAPAAGLRPTATRRVGLPWSLAPRPHAALLTASASAVGTASGPR